MILIIPVYAFDLRKKFHASDFTHIWIIFKSIHLFVIKCAKWKENVFFKFLKHPYASFFDTNPRDSEKLLQEIWKGYRTKNTTKITYIHTIVQCWKWWSIPLLLECCPKTFFRMHMAVLAREDVSLYGHVCWLWILYLPYVGVQCLSVHKQWWSKHSRWTWARNLSASTLCAQTFPPSEIGNIKPVTIHYRQMCVCVCRIIFLAMKTACVLYSHHTCCNLCCSRDFLVV